MIFALASDDHKFHDDDQRESEVESPVPSAHEAFAIIKSFEAEMARENDDIDRTQAYIYWLIARGCSWNLTERQKHKRIDKLFRMMVYNKCIVQCGKTDSDHRTWQIKSLKWMLRFAKV